MPRDPNKPRMYGTKTPDGEARRCGANKTNGSGKCTHPAGYGTDHVGWGRCKFHGGSTAAGRMRAAREKTAEAFMGDPVDIEPTEAILQQVRQSAGHVNWYLQHIRAFEQETGSAGGVLLQLSESGYDKAAWVKLYNEERDRLTRFAKTALDAGVAERQVRLAEKQGELIATAIRAILNDLGLTPDQEAAAPAIVERALRAVV